MSFRSSFDKFLKVVNDPGNYYSQNGDDKIKADIKKGVVTGMSITNGGSGYLSGTATISSPLISSSYISSSISKSTMSSATFTTGTSPYFSSGYSPSYSATYTTSIITLYNRTGQKIVELKEDGSVVWDKEIEIDEAAEAFGKSLNLSAEQRVGITINVKTKMRDSVFNDLIEIAKEKGPLSAEDLTYLLSASKIIEKLKGSDK